MLPKAYIAILQKIMSINICIEFFTVFIYLFILLSLALKVWNIILLRRTALLMLTPRLLQPVKMDAKINMRLCVLCETVLSGKWKSFVMTHVFPGI